MLDSPQCGYVLEFCIFKWFSTLFKTQVRLPLRLCASQVQFLYGFTNPRASLVAIVTATAWSMHQQKKNFRNLWVQHCDGPVVFYRLLVKLWFFITNLHLIPVTQTMAFPPRYGLENVQYFWFQSQYIGFETERDRHRETLNLYYLHRPMLRYLLSFCIMRTSNRTFMFGVVL